MIRINGFVLALGAASAVLLAGLSGCGGGHRPPLEPYKPTVAAQWDETALEAVRQLRPGPPIVARALAMVHTAIYDAWAAYDEKAVGTRLGGTLRRPLMERTQANKEKAMSFAAYRVLLDLWPTKKPLFDEKMLQLGYDYNDNSTDPTTAEGIGNRVGAALLAWRHNDGSNQLGDLHAGPYSDYTDYQPVNTVDDIIDPNHWQPLRFSNGAVPGFLVPFWGRVKTFSAIPEGALRPPPPPVAGTDEYARQTQQIIDLTANLTDRQKVISEYWSDGPGSVTPPGHWCLIAQWVATRDRNTLDDDVKMFFLVANGVLDASICCWDTKRFYDYCRPITAIRFLFTGQMIPDWAGPQGGTKMVDGKDWLPYQPSTFISPPFAEYTSGHSTFSAASAELLRRFTGKDRFGMSFSMGPGGSRLEPGVGPVDTVVLTWNTFSDAADEAGWSRRYGGIHFESGDLGGRQMGRQIGELVWNKAMSYFDGSADYPND